MENEKPKPTKPDIASVFAPHTWEEWKQAVEETLKGVPFDKAMFTKTYEGIELKPIYRKADIENLPHLYSLPGQPPYVRGNRAEGYLLEGWKIAQEQNECAPAEANKVLLEELNRGLNAVNLKPDAATLAGKNLSLENCSDYGISLPTLNDLCTVLKGVDLKAVPISIKAEAVALPMLAMLNAHLKKNDVMLSEVKGCVGYDPLAVLVKSGKLLTDFETAIQHMYQMTFWADIKAPNIRTVLLDLTVYADSGANAVQELGLALATANEYIKALMDKGLSIEQIAPHCQLNLSLGSNFFMEIAKVRATRLLWTELMKAYGASAESQKIWIHGITSAFNKTTFDPYANILRTTTEGFAGVIGGLDSLEITPFDEFVRPDEEFSRRIARNQQIILQEEAHFDKVTDPAGGCYYIETITAQLAEKAWNLMQEIESRGGMYKALTEGWIQAEVLKTADEKISNVNKRKDVYVGVNMYANPLEQPLQQTSGKCVCNNKDIIAAIQAMIKTERSGLQASLQYIKDNPDNDFMVDMITDAWLHDATIEEICDLLSSKEKSIEVQSLPLTRATQQLEELRTRIYDWQQKNEIVLSVFLANMGPIIQHKARADFASGLLQVGGIYVAGNNGFAIVEEAADAALFSKAQAVCICSTDETYPELVPQLVSKIKAKSPDVIFILAGYPQEMVETYKSQGINIFIHIRANAFDTLNDLANKMGVK
ncbi:MAG: methylmalonyl-CoA mutase family protein [Candidatus Cloacimonadaceae bacterium]